MLQQFFVAAPKLRPQLNIGCLHDIPNGRYMRGRHGESILNGGLAYVEGVGGRGNMGKSTLAHFKKLRILSRFIKSVLGIYDTETSLTFGRIQNLWNTLVALNPELASLDLEDAARVFITDNTVMSGNEWFAKLKAFAEDKRKNSKDWMGTTPFIDEKTGQLIQTMYPSLFELDSLSMFLTDSVEGIYEKNQIGDSAANTDSLRGAAAKSQMLMQLPTTTGQANVFLTMTMHVGDQHQLDPYAPQKKQLSYLKGGVAFKHVPQKITFLTNNLWYVANNVVLANKGTKAPEYPKDASDNMEGDTDLNLMTVQNLRAKNGPTGMPFELVWSQADGILVGLSEFNYIKSFDKYGMGGHDRAYFLELRPEVTLSRTTIRGKIDSDLRLQRALEITSELCQMKYLWDEKQLTSCWGDTEKLLVSPKELYEGLKAKGYDWDTLLDTRGYWVFEEEASGQPPFLSTLDLLRMNAGLYRPYWMEATK